MLGYYTLAARSIPIVDLDDGIRRRLPRYDAIPATLLGRLAVFYRRHGFRSFADSALRPFLPMASVAQLLWRG